MDHLHHQHTGPHQPGPTEEGSPTAAAAAAAAETNLPDPFSPSPSRSSSAAPSTRSSRSDDSISPSASASQVKDKDSEDVAAISPAQGDSTSPEPGLQLSRLIDEEAQADAQAGIEIEPPPPVDALQPSPLHMLTLLGSQLLQHDQQRQQEEQAREMGLNGIEELFNEGEEDGDLGRDEDVEEDEDDDARLELELEAQAQLAAQSVFYPGDMLEHSRAALALASGPGPNTPNLSASLAEDLQRQSGGAGSTAAAPAASPAAALRSAGGTEGDEQTPRGPLTPLQASQMINPPSRLRESVSAVSSVASSAEPQTAAAAQAESQEVGEGDKKASNAQPEEDAAPVTVAEQQVASSGTKRTLAFVTPDLAAGTPKRPSPNARELLIAHLTKLFSLSPTLTLADGSTRALRILSLHPAHLFRAGTLLTGTLYLTTTHVLFYAYLRPRAPGAVLQIGTLGVARGKGWGWADEAADRAAAIALAAAGTDHAGSQQAEGAVGDSVATLQGLQQQQQGGGRTGSFGAAARIGAFLRKPASVLGRAGSGMGTEGAEAGMAKTPSPSDSALLFGTTPTAKSPFAGFEPVMPSPGGTIRRGSSFVAAAAVAAAATSRSSGSSGRRAPRKRAHHFVLTPRSLSWFASERDPYFPIGQLDLRWIQAVYEPVVAALVEGKEKGHKVAAGAAAAAEWFIEYVIPPGPRKPQSAKAKAAQKKTTKTGKPQQEEDQEERRYTLLLRAPSADDAHAWCATVRRAVLRAGGNMRSTAAGAAHGGDKSSDPVVGSGAGGALDVRRDSVRVSIPLARIVDVEGSVGASGVSGLALGLGDVDDEEEDGGQSVRGRRDKGKARAVNAGAGAGAASSTGAARKSKLRLSVAAVQDEAEGRTFVIRVWDADAGAGGQRDGGQAGDAANAVVPLDEYCFVDVQRQHDLWRRLERALARIPAAPLSTPSTAPAGDEQVADLARTYTDQPPSFTYPPSLAEPLPPKTVLPRALAGPAKRLASAATAAPGVALGGLGALLGGVPVRANGLVERVREVWSVAPVEVADAGAGSTATGLPSSQSQSQSRSRSRSRSGSEGWVDHVEVVEDGEEGDAAEEAEADAEDGDAEADLADSMSFSIVDLSSSTAQLDAGGAEEDGSVVGGSAARRTSAEQHNLELFHRTFVLPLGPPSHAHSLSLSDSDIGPSSSLVGGGGGVLSSPGSRSGTSSSLERSTTSERLLHTFTSASLYRVLPLPGRLFVSERFLCFRSARGLASRVNAGLGGLAQGAVGLAAAAVSSLAIQPAGGRPLLSAAAAAGLGQGQGASSPGGGNSSSLPTAGSGAGGAATGGGRTLMMLPLADVIGVASNRAYRYGHWGMVVMIRGHEEIFFEFSSVNEQKLCISTIEHQMEVLHRNAADRAQRPLASTGNPAGLPNTGAERSDAFILRDLGERLDWSLHSSIHSSFGPRSGLSGLPLSSSSPHAAASVFEDAPTQAARRLRNELGMTSPVTSPSSPRLARAVLSPGGRSAAGEQQSGTGRVRARSISTMSAPGLRTVGVESSTGGAPADVSVAGTDSGATTTTTTTTTSSDLLSVSSKPKRSLHFTMLTIGSRGDVQPYIALSKRLLAEGHRVRIATHGEFREWIEGHDIEFYEVGGDPAELMRICVENGTFTLSFLKESVTKFRGWLDDLLVSSWEACQGTDIVIESPSAMAGIHIAEALQVPYFRAFTMPWTRTRTYPHAFAVPSGKAGGNYNYMTYVIFDQVFWRASAGQVNRWRRKTLGLRSTNLEEMAQHKVPFLYNFSPSLVPKPLDWYDWIHVTGFWFLDGPDNSKTRTWQPPAELVSFIQRAREARRKVVYIGWGSIVLSNAEETHDIVVQAVRQAGVSAILSKGWSDRLSGKKARTASEQRQDEQEEEDMSDRIVEVNSVPHDWLFPQLDAACHHGGAGTLGASLRAGIPTIVKPHFADQFFWGQQVETLGVGRCIRGELGAGKLADALVAATRDERMVRRARELGERIRREDGVGEAVKVLYRDLDYAASLIKRGTGLDGGSGGKKFVPSAASLAAAAQAKKKPAATGDKLESEQDQGGAALVGRKSRETVRDAPFATSSGGGSGGGSSGGGGIRPSPAARGAEMDDAGSDAMSEAWSVVSGSEDDRG
ncbi:Sterol 3-beta-glucosyltransferase [Tilletia horrida]|uniref:sterol 3beta-glucosyltransferase n=1 Tax=Tilletia horrida TaxID=155126 RepID=A0AAN6JSB0_9BASI|nr:Sterol 3-beta-glucosyltransferase [Tilletia horrida]